MRAIRPTTTGNKATKVPIPVSPMAKMIAIETPVRTNNPVIIKLFVF
jgi:hypothetical protein